MTKTSTASTIRAKIADLVAGRAKTEEQIAELEAQARWSEGQARRDRLTAHADEAAQFAKTAQTTTTAEMAAAAQEITDAILRLKAMGGRHNDAFAELHKKVVAEGVRDSFTPPSPADGGIGVGAGAVIVGEQHLVAVNVLDLVQTAVAAAERSDAVPTAPAVVIDKALGHVPFWRVRSNGNTMQADNPPGCDQISRAEFLASKWGLRLSDLPRHVLDTLSGPDRVRLAPDFLAELDDDARTEYATKLIPGGDSA
jgi:hypothetical protein